MKAKDHTQCMLRWWRRAGVDRADLAVGRPTGAMLWHHDLSIEELPLKWARAENAHGSEIYVRPARGHDWPVVFMDDVSPQMASRIARRYAALVIHTSPEGGCHVWLRCRRPLGETERKDAQRWLTDRVGADPASISGEHLGRLAGFKNQKRGGRWVNVLITSSGFSWDPTLNLISPQPDTTATVPRDTPRTGPDTSPSGREWGWVCSRLEVGCDPGTLYGELVRHAAARRGSDAARYAHHTITHALHHVRIKDHLPGNQSHESHERKPQCA